MLLNNVQVYLLPAVGILCAVVADGVLQCQELDSIGVVTNGQNQLPLDLHLIFIQSPMIASHIIIPYYVAGLSTVQHSLHCSLYNIHHTVHCTACITLLLSL